MLLVGLLRSGWVLWRAKMVILNVWVQFNLYLNHFEQLEPNIRTKRLCRFNRKTSSNCKNRGYPVKKKSTCFWKIWKKRCCHKKKGGYPQMFFWDPHKKKVLFGQFLRVKQKNKSGFSKNTLSPKVFFQDIKGSYIHESRFAQKQATKICKILIRNAIFSQRQKNLSNLFTKSC